MSRNNLRNIDLLGYRHREEEMRLDLKRYVDSDMDKDMILYHDNTHLYLLIEKGSEWADKYIKMKSGNAVMLSEIVYLSEHDIAVSVAIEELLLDTVITVSYDSSFNSIVNNYINNFLRDQDYTDEEPKRKSVDYRKNPFRKDDERNKRSAAYKTDVKWYKECVKVINERIQGDIEKLSAEQIATRLLKFDEKHQCGYTHPKGKRLFRSTIYLDGIGNFEGDKKMGHKLYKVSRYFEYPERMLKSNPKKRKKLSVLCEEINNNIKEILQGLKRGEFLYIDVSFLESFLTDAPYDTIFDGAFNTIKYMWGQEKSQRYVQHYLESRGYSIIWQSNIREEVVETFRYYKQ